MPASEGFNRRPVAALEAALRRDRIIVLSSLFAVVALAWAYTVYLAQNTSNMGLGSSMGMAMATPNMQSWGPIDFGSMFLMWAAMMTAMMLPSAAPMILLFGAVNRKRREQQRPYVPTGVFTLGYMLVWTGFAAAATLGNWTLHTHALLSSMTGESTSSLLGGTLLVVAGVFQWTPLKYACLTRCRSPLGFLMSEWREGTRGVLRMGLKHGVYCLACCWMLMGLLFVLGIMNLVWIAALAGFVLLEKVAPAGPWISRGSGLLLMGWGALMLAGILS